MHKSCLAVGVLAGFLGLSVQGCDSENIDPKMAAALQDDQADRLVTVYLQAETGSGFSPTYAERIVTAEPINLVPKTRAEGQAVYQNTNTVIIGDSCEKLRSEYPDLLGCSEVNAVDFEYGEIESTVTTDTEGFAALYLGGHEKYRVSVQSWPTREDDKCHWGGSETLEQTDSTIAITVLVFCE